MPDPVNTTITAAAVATGAVTIGGTILGVPTEAMIASLVGAGLALNAGARLEFSVEALRAALGIFITALAAGIYFGGLAGLLIDAAALKLLGVDLPDDAIRTGASFLLSLGAQRLLPALVERLRGGLSSNNPPQGPTP